MSGLFVDGRIVDDAAFYGAALNPAANVVVQACAGSGKTWLLAARVIRLLLAGAAPESIVAITFTNKAAAEMQERIFKWLEELALLQDAVALRARLREFYMPDADLDVAVERAPHLLKHVLHARQSLAIHTFHSWFLRLKSALALTEAEAVSGEIAPVPALLEADAWERFLVALNNDATLQKQYTWFVAQLGLEASRSALQVFIARRAEWLMYVENAARPAEYASESMQVLHGKILMRTAQKFVADCREDLLAIAKAFGQMQGVLAAKAGAALANALDPQCPIEEVADYAAQALLTQNETFNGRLAGLKEIKNNAVLLARCERVSHALAQLNEARRAQRLLALHQTWYALGHALVQAYENEKSAQNQVDFADLELTMARVLQDESAAGSLQARLDARVAHLLVDEFQDTNPLQWRILRGWLSGYAQDIAKPSLFLVGDAKQSIYRFRRADPVIFTAAAAFFREYFDARVLSTQRTRRNATQVNAFVNALFGTAAGPWGQDVVQEGPFATQVTLSNTPGQVEVFDLTPSAAVTQSSLARNPLTTPIAEEEAPALLVQARQVVHHLLALRDAAGESQPWHWGEVLVLVRSRASIEPMEAALREAGISYESSRRGGLLEAPEITDMQALCTVLATPQADLALAQVLRSPLFGFSDEDLVALWPPQPAPRGWAALATSQAAHHRQAFDYLTRWQTWAGSLPVHDLLDRIYAQHDVIRRYAAVTPAPRRAVAVGNLARMLELALDAHGGRYPSLPRFVQTLESFNRMADDETPDEATPQASQAVLITTVHSAKGLERNVVVLFDAHRNWRTPAKDTGRALIVWPPHADRPVHFSYDFGKDTRTTARNVWEQQEDAQQRIEAAALLYVAVTRARRHLIVAGSEKKRLTAQPTWWEVCAAAQPAMAWPQSSAVTNTAQALDGIAHYPTVPFATMPWQPANADETESQATLLGTAWHAALEHLAGIPVEQRAAMRSALCPRLAARYGLKMNVVNSLFDEALALMTHAPFAPLFDEQVKARAEWTVASVQGELLRIDRVVWLQDAAWIIDFKRVPAQATAAELPAEYGAQLQRYAQTVQALEPSAVIRGAVLTQHAQLFEWNMQAQRFEPRTGLH
jgi:ATP-dependent helicase/nuclease subunit A